MFLGIVVLRLNRSQGTVHCNHVDYLLMTQRPELSQSVPKGPYIATKRKQPQGVKTVVRLNRSQRDRTLQRYLLSKSRSGFQLLVSIGPKGTVHCNDKSGNYTKVELTFVSIGPKGTVHCNALELTLRKRSPFTASQSVPKGPYIATAYFCLLYTSDAADE